MYHYRENMTLQMREVCDEFYNQEKLKQQFLEIKKKLEDTRILIKSIKLPMKNEDGVDVVHGARFPLYRMEKHYLRLLNELEDFIFDEDFKRQHYNW